MLIGTQCCSILLQISRPHLGHTEITVLYSDSTFRYIQIENSDSTFGYIQFSPVSTFVVFAGMNIKENEKYM